MGRCHQPPLRLRGGSASSHEPVDAADRVRASGSRLSAVRRSLASRCQASIYRSVGSCAGRRVVTDRRGAFCARCCRACGGTLTTSLAVRWAGKWARRSRADFDRDWERVGRGRQLARGGICCRERLDGLLIIGRLLLAWRVHSLWVATIPTASPGRRRTKLGVEFPRFRGHLSTERVARSARGWCSCRVRIRRTSARRRSRC